MCDRGTQLCLFECPLHRREDRWPTEAAKNHFFGLIFSSGRELPPPARTVHPRCGALHARRVSRFRSNSERAQPCVGDRYVAALNADRKFIRPRGFASWLLVRFRRQPRRWRLNHVHDRVNSNNTVWWLFARSLCDLPRPTTTTWRIRIGNAQPFRRFPTANAPSRKGCGV